MVVATTAAEHELKVLHYDSDYERLAETVAASLGTHRLGRDRLAGP